MAELSCRGIKLHVQRLGDGGGPAVVFLHGLVMDNLSSWYFTVATQVAAQRRPVVLYDLRGHGKSERPARGYTLEDMVADLAALLDGLGLARVILVGNSFGGLLALAFARAFPARVAGLFLVDAHLGDEQFGPEMAATLRLTGEERDRRIAESFATWLGRHSDRKRNRLAETARALVHETSLVEDLARTPPLDPAGLARIEAKVVALYGEKSDLRARGEATLAALPHARVEVLAGCTHSILWEATAEVRRRALAFLAEVTP